MPKKAKKEKKSDKIAFDSDSDDNDDDFKKPKKKKGRKIAISDSSDDDVPRASTSNGKTCFKNSSMIIASTISRIFRPFSAFECMLI